MTKTSLALTKELHSYLVQKGSPPDEILLELEKETLALGQISRMQISAEQGAFMNLLVKLLLPEFCVEIGTFTGYSSICIARALPENAKLLCCDISSEWTSVAEKYWQKCGLSDKIELAIAPAHETLNNLGPDQKIDFAFIDADKQGYISYYDEVLKRLSPQGVILVDNVLWDGAVIDSENQDETTNAIREFNDYVSADAKTLAVILPVADGLMLITHK